MFKTYFGKAKPKPEVKPTAASVNLKKSLSQANNQTSNLNSQSDLTISLRETCQRDEEQKLK